MSDLYDLVVIGGGPAGYTGAIRASQLGLKVACIEARGTLGGTCLNVGCIPSKALLHATEMYHQAQHNFDELGIKVGELSFDLAKMLARKDKVVSTMTRGIEGLFKKNNVDYFVGHGSFEAPGEISVQGAGSNKVLKTKHTLIATGSSPIELPMAKFDEVSIVSSTGALTFDTVPDHLIVIGGGVIGLELGSVWARLGAKVTIVEAQKSILATMDKDIVRTMTKVMKKLGMTIASETMFKSVEKNGATLKVVLEKSGKLEEIEGDKLLVCVGRRAHTDNLGLEKINLTTEKNGKIKTDKKFQTSVSGVFAVGDVIDGPMLAHKAEEEAIACVEMIAGGAGHVNYEAIPNVVYTWPEVASVGLTEDECSAQGKSIKIGKFPFAANGRAKASSETEGFVKVLADAQTDRVLGIHICGPNASELIAEAAVAVEYQASSEDIARSVHAHPTLSEAIKEACLAVDNRTINI